MPFSNYKERFNSIEIDTKKKRKKDKAAKFMCQNTRGPVLKTSSITIHDQVYNKRFGFASNREIKNYYNCNFAATKGLFAL